MRKILRAIFNFSEKLMYIEVRMPLAVLVVLALLWFMRALDRNIFDSTPSHGWIDLLFEVLFCAVTAFFAFWSARFENTRKAEATPSS